MAKKTKKLEFSKIIILWSMAISTICIFGYSIGYFVKGTTPDTLITLIGTILTGTVIAYMGKALVENVNKINKTNESNDKEKTTKKKKKTEDENYVPKAFRKDEKSKKSNKNETDISR